MFFGSKTENDAIFCEKTAISYSHSDNLNPEMNCEKFLKMFGTTYLPGVVTVNIDYGFWFYSLFITVETFLVFFLCLNPSMYCVQY